MRIPAILVCFLATVPLAPLAAQTTHVVDVDPLGTNIYDPAELTVELGDTVRWEWKFGFHDVRSFQGLFLSGPPTFPPFDYEVVFDQAFLDGAALSGTTGTSFDYFCAPHLQLGMVGNVTVALPGRALLEVSDLQQGSTASVHVSRATPLSPVGVVWSLAGQGPTAVSAGGCGSLLVEVGAPFFPLPIQTSDASGATSWSNAVPFGVGSRFVAFQALDVASCSLSNGGIWRIRE